MYKVDVDWMCCLRKIARRLCKHIFANAHYCEYASKAAAEKVQCIASAACSAARPPAAGSLVWPSAVAGGPPAPSGVGKGSSESPIFIRRSAAADSGDAAAAGSSAAASGLPGGSPTAAALEELAPSPAAAGRRCSCLRLGAWAVAPPFCPACCPRRLRSRCPLCSASAR